MKFNIKNILLVLVLSIPAGMNAMFPGNNSTASNNNNTKAMTPIEQYYFFSNSAHEALEKKRPIGVESVNELFANAQAEFSCKVWNNNGVLVQNQAGKITILVGDDQSDVLKKIEVAEREVVSALSNKEITQAQRQSLSNYGKLVNIVNELTQTQYAYASREKIKSQNKSQSQGYIDNRKQVVVNEDNYNVLDQNKRAYLYSEACALIKNIRETLNDLKPDFFKCLESYAKSPYVQGMVLGACTVGALWYLQARYNATPVAAKIVDAVTENVPAVTETTPVADSMLTKVGKMSLSMAKAVAHGCGKLAGWMDDKFGFTKKITQPNIEIVEI